MLTFVGFLQGGMLSLESQIIDATTEDGQKMLEEMQEHERLAKEHEEKKRQDAAAAEGSSGQETEKPKSKSEGKGKAPVRTQEEELAAEID